MVDFDENPLGKEIYEGDHVYLRPKAFGINTFHLHDLPDSKDSIPIEIESSEAEASPSIEMKKVRFALNKRP